jgi:dipeptidyl-peptidase 4
MQHLFSRLIIVILFIVQATSSVAQYKQPEVNWTKDGEAYLRIKEGSIVRVNPSTNDEQVIVRREQFVPAGATKPLSVAVYTFSENNKKLLIFTNTAKVWRYNTRGDYWVLDLEKNSLTQLGKERPSQSLMFAKFSPDSRSVSYVSEHNIYVEDLNNNKVVQLTRDGTRKLINGTFDWAYEEEFGCFDGFRWSPDSKSIAYWQVDATKIRDYYMLNTTDSVYSRVIPVEYPKVGESPSAVKIGVVPSTGGLTLWMKIPGDMQQNYIPHMEWAGNSDEIVVQQLNRKQNTSRIIYANSKTGNATVTYTETDKAWIDIKPRWNTLEANSWDWINGGKEYVWISEKDGWRHAYRISRDGKKEALITKGNYDIGKLLLIDEKNNYIYFSASPENATQLYLYRTRLDGKGNAERLTPKGLDGTHKYNISPNAKYALHRFSSHAVYPAQEWITMADHKPIDQNKSIARTMKPLKRGIAEYFQITTEDNVTVDGWLVRPANFDSSKKWPVVFYVYGEPGATTTDDEFGNHQNYLFDGDMSEEGYFHVALDNRGTPMLKGAAWRKSIYRKIGDINIRDQAMAAKKLLDKPYFDKDRVAVWGWSGGGSTTLNLMFKYPEIYKHGVAIAAVANQLYYDNIYQERYMGLPQENREDFLKGSPVTYAKNLRGNLLYVHGTGDDNVHYSNAEALVNELIRYKRLFQFMPYPNRTHNISEGENTFEHLQLTYTKFLRTHCPAGPR